MVRRTQDILDEGTQRTKGQDALNSNIEAAKAVANIVKTTLGPMGMDKMLIDSMGETVITNDGVKILKEMEIEHPGAKLLVEVAKTQDNEVGDGTTTAVILSGELLSKAQELIKQKIHPTTIIHSYKKAADKALEILEKQATTINLEDKKILNDVCETAMTGKVAEFSKHSLSNIIFETVSQIKDKNSISKDKIKIVKAAGGNTSESFVVKGIVLDKKVANTNMPKQITNAKILLLETPLEVRELESDAKININSLQEYEEFLSSENNYLKQVVEQIKLTGANTIICQKGIDDSIAYYLAKENILAIRRARKSDMEKLSSALNTNIISNIEDISKNNLGKAGNVEIKNILGENYIFVEDCENPKSITIFLKASTPHFLDEIERALDDAFGDLNALMKSKKIVAGGGAIELELHKGLSEYAKTLSGKQQIIVNSFADAFLIIPKVLCENSGFDEIETIANLISKHSSGKHNCGIDGFEGVIEDTLKKGIVEPINVKSQAIKSASESCAMILKIDDIIAAKRLTEKTNSMEEF